MRLDGDSHFRTLARSRSGCDQGGTPQTGPDPPVCVDCVPGAMFTMKIFSWLVSSEHEGLSPEWRSYRTRDVGSHSLRGPSVILSGFY